MENKEKRRKVEDREALTEDQKMTIARKSDDRCAWCGKKVFFGYGATVDHFVPIKKGGTNEMQNLVMMCEICNKKKSSRLIAPTVAARYLKEGPKKELEQYIDAYLDRYEYTSRGNLFSFDVYPICVYPESLREAASRAKKHNKSGPSMPSNPITSRLLKRAYPEDEEMLTAYFIKYLKKYHSLGSEEAARGNIKFWMRFGTIYYIEQNGEISVMCPIIVNRHGYISLSLFSYYSTLLAKTLCHGLVSCLTDTIMEEHNIAYLPFSLVMLTKDTMTFRLIDPSVTVTYSDNLLTRGTFFAYNRSLPYKFFELDENSEQFKKDVLSFSKFINAFTDIENDISLYLYENNLMDISWMADEILEMDVFDDTYYRDIEDLKKNNT